MKKQLWIFGVTAISMLAGCSGDDEPSSPGAAAGNGSVVGVTVNSDVEIRLSSKSGGTRGSVETISPESGLFEVDGLGIFCLATGFQDRLTDESIDWSANAEDPDYNPVLMDNLESDAVLERDHSGAPVSTSIVWKDGMRRMYPHNNRYNYHFYGYYPRVSDIYADSHSRIASIPIDGTQDIIWGRTTSDDPLAYSARYFHQAGNGDKIPGLAFSHKLMRITFSCVPGADAKGSIESALKMGVKSIAIKRVPTTARLVVADSNDETNEGTVTYDWENGVADFMLKDTLDADFRDDHWVLGHETTLGQGILLPVPTAEMEAAGFRYELEIVLKDKDGHEFVSDYPIELQNKAGYQAGKSYNVQLTVYGPMRIYLNATLAGWIPDEDNTIGGVTL